MSTNNVTTNNTTTSVPVQTTLLPLKMFNDAYRFYSLSCKEFIDTVKEYESEDEYKRVVISGLSVFALEDAGDEIDANIPSALSEASGDTMMHLRLGIEFESEGETYVYPLRETAKKSLLDRAKINGASLEKLSRSQLSTVLNMCYRLYPESNSLVYINNNKVNAVLSGDTKDFSVLPLTDLLNVLHNKFKDLSFNFQFVEGYLDHWYCFSKYDITDSNLLEKYQEALTTHGIPFNPRRMKAAVQFASSNVGMATAKVTSFLKNEDRYIPLGTACQTQHRGGKTVEDFENSLMGMFASYQEALTDLTKLMDIKLKHPVDVMTKVCQKLKYPKEQSIEAIQLFQSYAEPNKTTAYDLYCALGEVLFNCRTSKIEETKTFIYAEDMPKVLGYSEREWKKFDSPLSDGWGVK